MGLSKVDKAGLHLVEVIDVPDGLDGGVKGLLPLCPSC